MVISKSQIEEILDEVKDPEIPVISIADLGILRDVKVSDDGFIEVVITPTYTGCPAMMEIERDINNALKKEGINDFKITTVLSPAWSTDLMTEEGKARLKEYGIAPPNPTNEEDIECPNCGSRNTKLLSQFGSTACKSLFKCNDCLEPFDYFKCH
ncbi:MULTISPECIES: 1,2-phenylacetyl-CoA epoxidase subunit PaaD [Roseivirga]|uniref:Phenylacetate-CoA oxygenase subunit PaaJ n=1 Tax=Roseivirga spongicola TaxID=333140 RepID=A0A150X5K0_9BACT|nr:MULTISPECIES: 1,2-phenylacetyl-CoA epoxidase subunit PaaD [Roseivirga]KYG73991.1 phenylacetate-CoA oxygenase subunit PaaJ [Roseivirga spongicola]MBO6660296.1 phenylacetate-CoA oxygenase subunit PaaJ [Roseivirga sp.]MBO6760788.1 phenylacetate-CoA oxygenase subunit PaaJ [Roseivirga sp.]MBO6906967.1 phenylacetate-CoA oxygenase subunit PaaJ [Roseivirga sp.]WPZ09362.1 1,2-phenylacetyl-CoA epoxidase subunit PaaD [Roseivirga spongicola]